MTNWDFKKFKKIHPKDEYELMKDFDPFELTEFRNCQ